MLDFPLSALPPNSQKVRLNRKQEVGAGGGWLAFKLDRRIEMYIIELKKLSTYCCVTKSWGVRRGGSKSEGGGWGTSSSRLFHG